MVNRPNGARDSAEEFKGEAVRLAVREQLGHSLLPGLSKSRANHNGYSWLHSTDTTGCKAIADEAIHRGVFHLFA